MNKRLRGWLDAHALLYYPVCALATALLVLTAGKQWLYAGVAALLLFAFRPGSALHRATVETCPPWKVLVTVLAAAATAAACLWPMGKLPLWNGESPAHRNQYELMAEAILDGRIEFAYGDEDTLKDLENPYDPDAREEAGVYYHWDHAYYKGHYYMYFGIVPVLLVFIPYRLLTGASLTTYHATQFFTLLIIAGIFALFWMAARLFFRKLSFAVYIALSVGFSAMSVWYACAEPALYCTAITAAVALEVWSLFFFIRAVWGETRENRQIALAGVGALLGALAFGCRPTVALANLLVIPMLAVFLKKRSITWKLIGKLALAALPYVLVGVALMVYNYVRFEDPFEFGQAYQLTVADQHDYRVRLDGATILRVINDTVNNLFAVGRLDTAFPYLRATSAFSNFPILFLTVFAFLPALRAGRERRVGPLLTGLVAVLLVISAFEIVWTPFLLERYRMDLYFLLGILCFLTVGLWYGSLGEKGRRRLGFASMSLAAATVVSSFLLCVYTVGVYYPEKVGVIGRLLGLA